MSHDCLFRHAGQWLALETLPHSNDLSGSWASVKGGPMRVTLPIASPPEPREGLVGLKWVDVLLDEKDLTEGPRLSQALSLGESGQAVVSVRAYTTRLGGGSPDSSAR